MSAATLSSTIVLIFSDWIYERHRRMRESIACFLEVGAGLPRTPTLSGKVGIYVDFI